MDDPTLTTALPIPDDWLDEPLLTGMLPATGDHEVWWAAFGQDTSVPVLVLHGGPGSGSNLKTLAFFDPAVHRVIFFDQRGSGRSTPLGELSNNETAELVADIESLRQLLGIRAWSVYGGSWGADLGLVYGQLHPESCVKLILRSIPDRHLNQNQWVLKERPTLQPERHEAFMSYVRQEELFDPIGALYRASLSNQREEVQRATAAVIVLELGLAGPDPEPLVAPDENELSAQDIARARIFLHYWANQSFLPEGRLVFNSDALKDVPLLLVHGVSDWICPKEGSEAVHRAVPHSELILVEGAGHSAHTPAMQEVLRAVIETL